MANQSNFLVNFWNRFINFIIGPIDNSIATPFNNGVFLDNLGTGQTYPGPDAKDPYPTINNSPDASFIKGGVLGLAIFSILTAIIVNFYKKIRKKEGHSHYFFFEKSPDIKAWLEHTNESAYSPEILLAATYFYNPDLPYFVLRWRRSGAWITRHRDYLELQKHLKSEASKGKTKEEAIREIQKEILKKLALYINEKGKYGEWVVEETDEKFRIQPTENTHQILQAWNKLQNETQEVIPSQKKSVGKKISDFIEARLDELGIGSYAYWIGVFTFYLLAGVGVTAAGIVWPPILIAGSVLLLLWASKIIDHSYYQSIQAKSTFNSTPDEPIPQIDDENTIVVLETIQQQIQQDALNKQKIRFQKSKLKKDIDKTLNKTHDVRYVWPIFNGFMRGLFTVLFVGWLLTAALGLIVTLNPIGTAILAVTILALAIAYGLYMAVKNYQTNNLEIITRENRWKTLEKLYEYKDIPDISLQEYDRLLRRNSADKTLGTSIKQFFKRTWVGFSRVGTGILFLKLTGLGITTAVCLALGITISAAFFPMLGILLAAGTFFAAWHIYQYQLESQQDKIDRVVKLLVCQSSLKSSTAPINSLPEAESSSAETESLSHCRNAALNQEKNLLSQKNLINVSTQNNFCGYYVLARRVINDEHFEEELLDKFNQFYSTSWSKEQLTQVLKHMHPNQADAVLGLVLYNQDKRRQDGKGLDVAELTNICKDFGYDLKLFNCNHQEIPDKINLANFTPQSQSNLKEILVLFHQKDQKIGHYYLVEPGDAKAIRYNSQKSLSEEYFLYTINNEGNGTEEFIQNVKNSIQNIDKLIELSAPASTHFNEESNHLPYGSNKKLTFLFSSDMKPGESSQSNKMHFFDTKP